MRIFRRYVPGKSKCAKHSTRPGKTKNIRAEALMFYGPGFMAQKRFSRHIPAKDSAKLSPPPQIIRFLMAIYFHRRVPPYFYF